MLIRTKLTTLFQIFYKSKLNSNVMINSNISPDDKRYLRKMQSVLDQTASSRSFTVKHISKCVNNSEMTY